MRQALCVFVHRAFVVVCLTAYVSKILFLELSHSNKILMEEVICLVNSFVSIQNGVQRLMKRDST